MEGSLYVSQSLEASGLIKAPRRLLQANRFCSWLSLSSSIIFDDAYFMIMLDDDRYACIISV